MKLILFHYNRFGKTSLTISQSWVLVEVEVLAQKVFLLSMKSFSIVPDYFLVQGTEKG